MSREIVVNPIYGRVNIRLRERRLASPPEGMRQSWAEWQVCQGRRVLSRHDTEQCARKWVRDHTPREWHTAVRHCL